jgi:adenosine deaminase
MQSIQTRVRLTVARTIRSLLLATVIALGACGGAVKHGEIDAEARTAAHFDAIRGDPARLEAFLRAMPKGGDLHNHLSGAVPAESIAQWAADQALCVELPSMKLVAPTPAAPCDAARDRPAAAEALATPAVYDQAIDAWSMRHWSPASGVSGHDHFFATFGKFDAATRSNTGRMLAEAASRAAAERLSYVEFMLTPDDGRSLAVGNSVGWDDDLARLRAKLLASGIADAAAAVTANLDRAEAVSRRLLACDTPAAHAACGLTVRYQFQVYRGNAKHRVFAQMVAAFEAATRDPRLVALNLVQPEDGATALADFSLQMRMLEYLHGVYPGVHIALHAGELVPDLAAPEALTFHIRESIEVGRAERIGHGVDVLHESRPDELLRDMAQRRILVEICLTSNDVILGVTGARHPLASYLAHGVPVALATDDPGVSRSNMTLEYVKGVLEQPLDYRRLKAMARDSLEHAFVPGTSLWQDSGRHLPVAACAADWPSARLSSDSCRNFVGSSTKAGLQWRLEEQLAVFELAQGREQ